MKYRIFIIVTLTFCLGFLQAFVVFAHGDEPRLEISVERMHPGGVVEVRGVDFEFEELISLALIGHEFEYPLGEITADTDGIFLHIVTLPTDLTEGSYNFRAITDDHEILSPALLIQGSAIISEAGGQGERDEDDGLLAPMPTFAPGVVPGGVSQAAAQLAPQETPVSSRNSDVLVVLGLLVMGVFAALGLRVLGKR
ncbi:MAG TPA: hypothetical protein VGA72_03215 [Anaerolineales bacterium]